MKELNKTLQELLYAADKDLLSDPVGRSMKRSFDFGVAGEFDHKLLSERVNKHRIAQAFAGPYEEPQLHAGNFIQGKSPKNQAIQYSHLIRQEPTVVIGCTGSGKTNLFRFESLQWALLTKGLWLVDLRKNDFTSLVPLYQKIGVNLQVINARKLKANILQVPLNVDPAAFASALSDSLTAILDLPIVAQRILFQGIFSLYQQFGVFNGSQNYPTVFELLEIIRNNKKVHRSSREALVVRLETMLLSLKDVLCYRRGFTHHDFATRKVVFSFNEITETDQDILLNWLLLSEFMSRIASGKSNKPIELKVFIDESNRLVSNGNTSISSLISVVRGSGVALTLGNQEADLARSITSNSPNKILARCSNVADYHLMGSSMGLSSEQIKYFQQNVQPGTFACVLGQGPWRKPFLFTVPLLNVKQPNQIKCDCPELNALPVEKADEFSDWQPEWVRDSIKPIQITPKATLQKIQSAASSGTKITNSNLTDDEKIFLEAVATNPCKAVSFYPSIVHFSKRKALKIRESLIKNGYVQEQKTQTNGRGRPSILLAPTQQGLDIVQNLGAN